ncbi:YgfZ/GcvT domain-containing protein [Parvibium lacunae]|nr:folate-binding protein [Parvibium lacunae]
MMPTASSSPSAALANLSSPTAFTLPAELQAWGSCALQNDDWDFWPHASTPAAPSVGGAGWTSLPHLSHLTVTGADAVSFLQGQLTNDVALLPLNQAQWTGYCSPKGRLLATMLLWKTAGATDAESTVHLLADTGLVSNLIKRLRMYVLRAKATVSQTDDLILASWGNLAAITQHNSQPYQVSHPETGLQCLAMPLSGQLASSSLWVASQTALPALVSALQDTPCQASAVWRLALIGAGIAHIQAATQEAFVPQIVNYELIGGVNFKKGCYPGQEVVARSQYLGKLKRRMYRYATPPTRLSSTERAAISAGIDVWHTGETAQPVGRVVNVAATQRALAAPAAEPDSVAYELLLEIPTELHHQGGIELRLTAPVADAPTRRVALLPLELPYTVPNPTAA